MCFLSNEAGQLLSVAESGAKAKYLIQEGCVFIDGQVCKKAAGSFGINEKSFS